MNNPPRPDGVAGLAPEAPITAATMPLAALQRDSVGGDGRTMAPPCQLALDASFGSIEHWRDDFLAGARALGDAAGWGLVMFLPRQGTLVNRWTTDADGGPPEGLSLLALAVHAQAQTSETALPAAAQAEAFVDRIDWARVYPRYQQAVQAASERFGARADETDGALLIDVRRAAVYEQAATVIQGACWRDPARVASWAGELPADRPLTVYCVHGHELSRAAALRLRAAGLDARFLRGGIEAWQAAGRPVHPRGVAP